MATGNKFNAFAAEMPNGAVNFSSDTIKFLLTNTAPSATNSVYSDISATELANGNGYTTGGSAVTGVALSNVSGEEIMAANPTTWTSNTGNMGKFRLFSDGPMTVVDCCG